MDERLVSYHLGQLSAAEAAELERAMGEDVELAERSRRLGALLDKLESYSVPAPPAGLADGVMQRVAGFRDTTVRLEEAGSALPSGLEAERSGSAMWSVRELVGLAAAITIFVGIFLPAHYRARYVARRDGCQANLAQIGRAVASYAGDHGGAMPFAGYAADSSWLRGNPLGLRYLPNSRHVYVLPKYGYVKRMRIFVCPGRREDVVMEAEEPEQFDGFAQAANISYSSQHVGRVGLRINIHTRMPILADRNPFVGRDRFDVWEHLDVNSDAHGRGTGQNVLYRDGSVDWRESAQAGPGGDNIWLIGQQRRYLGIEEPLQATDAFLIP